MQLAATTQVEDLPSCAVPGWRPDELGLGRAALMASAALALIGVGLAILAGSFIAPSPLPSPPVAVRLIEPSTIAALAAATPAEAAQPESMTAVSPASTMETIPPAAELTALSVQTSLAPTPPVPAPMDIAPAPVPSPASSLAPETTPEPMPPPARPSKVVLPAKRAALPAPSRLIRPRPATRPHLAESVERPLTFGAERALSTAAFQPAPAHAASSPNPQAAPADISSGLGPYRSALHCQIERNMTDNQAVQRLGISGTAVIEASIATDGRVLSARIARTSGNRAIDQAALAAVQHGGFAAFGAHMPPAPITISVPIGVEAE